MEHVAPSFADRPVPDDGVSLIAGGTMKLALIAVVLMAAMNMAAMNIGEAAED